MQRTYPPKLAQDEKGVWMQWGWEGMGGKRMSTAVDKPADPAPRDREPWVDPWVLSLDWATTDLSLRSARRPR
jgi:hypothetical protein